MDLEKKELPAKLRNQEKSDTGKERREETTQKMKKSSTQLNTKDDKQDKNSTKMLFTLHSSSKIVIGYRIMLKLLPKLGPNYPCLLLFLYTVTS